MGASTLRTLDVDELVDGQKLGWFSFNLLLWSFLAMFADGYDISVMPFAAPALSKLWHIGPKLLTPLLTASNYGVLLGAPLLGYVGDRFGRKTAIIAGSTIVGLSTLGVMAVAAPWPAVALRFLGGVGIGGLMPNTIALNSELSPKRRRATLVVLMFTGITLGSGTPGLIAAYLLPHYGWRALFVLGGAVPLAVAGCLGVALPESIKFLARQPARRAQAAALARRLRPELAGEDIEIAPGPAQVSSGLGLGQILGPGFRFITPLLWACFCMALMANYFLNTWMPLLYTSAGLPAKQAALASSLYHVGGTVGGLLISVLLDRAGMVVIAALFLAAVPVVAAIGASAVSFAALAPLSLAAGLAVLGAQFGNNASAGLLYPTAFRSKGVGWALAVGRLGSIVGPTVGGILIARHWSMQRLFVAASVPMVVGAVAGLALVWLCWRRLGELRLSDVPRSGRAVA
ncbi:MAG TPA: MFS transporter [Steroidobacteraceae bacterium]|nr:MFS transporter [Steroidobacteraceae bacterium]